MLKKQTHTPPHLLLDDTLYFVTGAIYRKRRLLAHAEIKSHFQAILAEVIAKFTWELHHWVILDNHYHWLGRSHIGRDLTRIVRQIHSRSGFLIRQHTNCTTPVWWNYWDYCPRNETDYFTRCNYLLNNPVKHGYVTNLVDYPHSSFHSLINEIGRESLSNNFRLILIIISWFYVKLKMMIFNGIKAKALDS